MRSTRRRWWSATFPADQAIIELGGSLGVISKLIRSRLNDGQKHIIVEPNPALVEICRTNAVLPGKEFLTDVVPAAIGAQGGTAQLLVGADEHSSRLAAQPGAGTTITVATQRLSDIARRLGDEPFTLVADIEGAELHMVQDDGAALQNATMIIIECHPEYYQSHGAGLDEFLELCRALGFQRIDASHSVAVLARRRPD